MYSASPVIAHQRATVTIGVVAVKIVVTARRLNKSHVDWLWTVDDFYVDEFGDGN